MFQTKVEADAIIQELAVTPFGSVWLWKEPEANVNQIQYTQDATGRCAIAHSFSEEDRDWIEAYLDSMTKVQILDALPGDWQYPTDLR